MSYISNGGKTLKRFCWSQIYQHHIGLICFTTCRHMSNNINSMSCIVQWKPIIDVGTLIIRNY